MNPDRWLQRTDAVYMAFPIKELVSDRKFRLFACACARRIWDRLPDPRSRLAVETAERYADGEASLEEMAATYRPAHSAVPHEWRLRHPGQGHPYFLWAATDAAESNGFGAAMSAALDAGWEEHELEFSPAQAEMAVLLRDIVGNPFRPVAFNHLWRTPDIVALARDIYDRRAFDHMPDLADALEAIGCDEREVLDHCRGAGPHARGCWVVDEILGRD